MEFVETHIFTERIGKLLTDQEYRQLQSDLVRAPKQGDVIPGGSGLRKLRWGTGARGKRGGIRVIYYCETRERFYRLFAYDKARQGDLTRQQLKMLSDYVKGGVL
jgi:hypothetical protein